MNYSFKGKIKCTGLECFIKNSFIVYRSKITAFAVNYKLTVVCVCALLFLVFQQEYGSLLGSERAASSGLFSGQTPQPTGTKTPMPSEGDVWVV